MEGASQDTHKCFRALIRPPRHLLSRYSVLPQAPERQLIGRGTTKAFGRSWNLQQGSENKTNVLVNTCKLGCCFLRFILYFYFAVSFFPAAEVALRRHYLLFRLVTYPIPWCHFCFLGWMRVTFRTPFCRNELLNETF